MRNQNNTDFVTVDTDSVTTGDMSISFVNVPSTIDNMGNVPALQVSTSSKHDVIGLDSDLKNIPVCVNMKARELPDDDSQRSDVDIIVALDVSGSMSGQKLNLCKNTLLLLLRVLYPEDRFGLICYAENAVIEIPVQSMNEANKKQCVEKIQGLRTRGCTNMSAAVGLVREEMRQIQTPNDVQTVFFLTDGHANAGIKGDGLVEFTKNCFVHDSLSLEGTEGAEDAVAPAGRGGWIQRLSSRRNSAQGDSKPATIPMETDKPKSANPITMHCFGVGTDHDSILLQALSDVVPGGSYVFIEHDVDIGAAFGDALGGVLSVVAQNVVVTISVPKDAEAKGVAIAEVHHENAVKRANGTYTIAIGDFYAEESRDVLFEVQLANSSGTEEPVLHAEISVSYTDTIRKMPADANQTTCMIARPLGTQLSTADPHVDVQWARVMATQAMEEANTLAEANDYSGATTHLRRAQASVRLTKQSAPAAYRTSLDFLDNDMTILSGGLSSASMYKSGGAHTAKMTLASHSKQRASTVAPSAYSSKKKISMKKRFTASS